MVGAHLDSWHTGTGATDNADGVATVMEAMRILKTLGVQPKRTIRVRAVGGRRAGPARLEGLRRRAPRRRQEQGRARQVLRLLQPRQRLPADHRLLHGRQRSGAQDHGGVAEAAREPRRDHPVARAHRRHRSPVVPRRSASPASRRCRTTSNYDVRTHHTNMDTAERIEPAALKQARGGDGGGALSRGDARREVPEARAAQAGDEIAANARQSANQAIHG